MNQRFSDYVFAEYLHPVSIALRLAVTGVVDTVTIDGPQQLPHREFVHQRLELIFKREYRWLVPLSSFPGRSRLILGMLSNGVGCRIAHPE